MADPLLLVQPFISINGVDMACYAKSISVTADDDVQDIATFCTPTATRFGATEWTIEIEWMVSYDTSGSDVFNTLLALAKTSVAIIIRPDTGTIGVTNPQLDCTAYMPTPSFIDGGIGEATTFTMSITPTDDPVFTTA